MKDLIEIKQILNDNGHLNCRWIIFTHPPEHVEVYFHGVGPDGTYKLAPEEAEKAIEVYPALLA